MPSSFKQLPSDFLLTTWNGKLPANVGEAYSQMARIIAERDLNLAVLFSELTAISQAAADGVTYLGDKETDGSWRLMISGSSLLFQRRESSAWVTKGSF